MMCTLDGKFQGLSKLEQGNAESWSVDGLKEDQLRLGVESPIP